MPECLCHHADYALGNLVLQGENVIYRPVELVGPQMRAGIGFDELAGDAKARARLAHLLLARRGCGKTSPVPTLFSIVAS